MHFGDVEAVFDRHGYAVQRSVAAGGRFVGGDRFPQCGLAPELHDGVHGGVDGLSPREQHLGELAGGELLATDSLRRVGRRPEQWCLVRLLRLRSHLLCASFQRVTIGSWSSVTHAFLSSPSSMYSSRL